MSILNILFIAIQVAIIDGILSLDNAAVLGAIASKLPATAKAPLPSWLSWLGTYQREAALKVGILGAYVGRGLMLLITGTIIQFPVLRLLGALYLLYLVAKYFWELFQELQAGDSHSKFAKRADGFWKTVLMIEIADLVFSLDNVIAVVALSSHILIVIFGVCFSILIMRFAASLFMKLINFEPWLEHAAYVLIFAIAIELILKFFHVEVSEIVQFSVSMAILAIFMIGGRVGRRMGIISSI